MTGEDVFMMSQKERKKLHVIRKMMDREITQLESGRILGLTTRQIKRLVKRVRLEGDWGVCHKGRGKRSNRGISEQTKQRVIKIYQDQYAGFGPTLATEKLLERNRIRLSEETLRRWLKEAEIPYKKRKKKGHRQWRERRAHCGSLVQLDGSVHPWFEARGPKCVLMAYVDDATGRVFGRFYEYEGTIPAMESFKLYILKYGLPMAIYADKHTTYKSSAEPTIEEQLEGIDPMSQFERSLNELGVEMIHAHSPQAKGRIERLFGTFQDRLVKEMRLAGICTLQEANLFLESYLPIYNAKYNVEAREGADLHRLGLTSHRLDQVLCIKTTRTVKNDHTISYQNNLYQIRENIRAKRVTIEERIDGTVIVNDHGKTISYQRINSLPKKTNKMQTISIKIRKRRRPSLQNLFNKKPRNMILKALANKESKKGDISNLVRR